MSAEDATNALIEALHQAADKEEDATTFHCTHNYLLAAIPPEIKLLRPFVQVLHIDNCFELKSLHPGIGDLVHLRWLNISYNQLTELPVEIAKLRNLERLHANNNAITAIPVEFWALKGLEELRLENNRIRAVPTGVLMLPKLREVLLENNPLLTLSDVDGAEPSSVVPPLPLGDCSNCNIRFTRSTCFITFHKLAQNAAAPVVNYVCSDRCAEQMKVRLATYDRGVKEDDEKQNSPIRSGR